MMIKLINIINHHIYRLRSATYSGSGITNPVIKDLGDNAAEAASGALFSSYFVSIWRALMSFGAIAVIVMYVWGALEWLTSGSDSKGVESGRKRVTNATIGLLVLVSTFTFINFIGKLLFQGSFDLLKLTLPDPNN